MCLALSPAPSAIPSSTMSITSGLLQLVALLLSFLLWKKHWLINSMHYSALLVSLASSFFSTKLCRFKSNHRLPIRTLVASCSCSTKWNKLALIFLNHSVPWSFFPPFQWHVQPHLYHNTNCCCPLLWHGNYSQQNTCWNGFTGHTSTTHFLDFSCSIQGTFCKQDQHHIVQPSTAKPVKRSD